MTKIHLTAFSLSVLILSACGDDVTKVTQETSGLESWHPRIRSGNAPQNFLAR